MVELSEIDDVITVELSIVELSIELQLSNIMTGMTMLFLSSVEFGWSST